MKTSDYRKNTREGFIRWYAWSLEYKDCDPSVWMTNYLNLRFEHNDEQKLWLSWLYGNTYYLPTSWIMLNEFPDFELATVDRITYWNTHNYSKLRYQTDTKWNKGHFPTMFDSYKTFIGNTSQREKLNSYLGDNEDKSFNNLWDAIKSNLHKFGRYSTWFYMQHLYHTCNIPCKPTSLFLSDYSGSRSHRNGLLHALGKSDLIDTKLSTSEYNSLESEAKEILIEMQYRFPHLVSELNFYTMETCLCSFKKLFRKSRGRYLSYYLDRQAEEIMKVENDNWVGIDWNVLWQARNETIDIKINKKTGVDDYRYKDFLETGKLNNLEWMFSDEKPVLDGIENFF